MLFKKNIDKLKLFAFNFNAKFQKIKAIISPSELQKKQRNNPLSIPVIIINFNQLFYLEQLLDFLLAKKHENIVIIDNYSTYPPLLSFYQKIAQNNRVKIIFQEENLGHLVFWKDRKIYNEYAKGYFIITDADIVPNSELEDNYANHLIKLLHRYPSKTKVGLALKINDLPNYYNLKDKVINWEEKFWKKELEKDVYSADIDTTFALYWPFTDRNVTLDYYRFFFKGIRLGGKFSAKHGGWYINHNELTEEQRFYLKTANASNSWKIDENGELKGDFIKDY